MPDFNVLVSKKKAICPQCKGDKTVRELDEWGDYIWVTCPLCKGDMVVVETITAKYERYVEAGK